MNWLVCRGLREVLVLGFVGSGNVNERSEKSIDLDFAEPMILILENPVILIFFFAYKEKKRGGGAMIPDLLILRVQRKRLGGRV